MRTRATRAGAQLVLVAVLLALAGPARAAGSGLELKETVAGRALADSGRRDPIVLRASTDAVVRIEVTNHTGSPVEVRSVRLDARVLGLAFVSYTTRVDLMIAPGATGTRAFSLDLGDLRGQALGLMNARLSLLAPDRSVLGSDSGTVDVRGSLLSVYGVFGLAVVALTLLLLARIVSRARRRLLGNRAVVRALGCVLPGLGLGLSATFFLGLLRVLAPTPTTSVLLMAGGVLIGLGLGLGLLHGPSTAGPATHAEADAPVVPERASAAGVIPWWRRDGEMPQAGVPQARPTGPASPAEPRRLIASGGPETEPGEPAPLRPAVRLRPAQRRVRAPVEAPVTEQPFDSGSTLEERSAAEPRPDRASPKGRLPRQNGL